MKGIGRKLAIIGPGVAVAATGVGAGDMVAAAVSGARFGLAVAWAVLIGAAIKYLLNEGLARWQLATGKSLIQGWVDHFGPWVRFLFLAYLLVWSLMVGAALMSACGLAAHALWPRLSVQTWGILHSLSAALFVLFGRYRLFESFVKIFIGLMFIALIGCAFLIYPPHTTFIEVIGSASVPTGSARFLLGVIGGVGGSLTLLSYGYWIRERGWKDESEIGAVRLDLKIAYILTGLFGFAVMVLAAKVLHVQGIEVKGQHGVLQMAGMLQDRLGTFGKYTFIFGFWAAVTTSVLGVWQSVPYLFCEFVFLSGKRPEEERPGIVNTRSKWYRCYLAYLTFIPATILFFGKPVALIVLYSVVGAMFMPFLAGTMLVMNSRADLVGNRMKYTLVYKIILALSLVLFGYLCLDELLVLLG